MLFRKSFLQWDPLLVCFPEVDIPVTPRKDPRGETIPQPLLREEALASSIGN